jgi:hypothetical protein
MTTSLTPVTTPLTRIALDFQEAKTNGKSGIIGKLVAYERNSESSCCPAALKSWTIFFIKKAFAFLDLIGIGSCLVKGGLKSAWNTSIRLQGIERNQLAREAIVAAIGGPQVCNTIPVVSLSENDLTDYLKPEQKYLKLEQGYFPSGKAMIQGIAVEKVFVAFLVENKTTKQTETITIHQYHPETDIEETDRFCDGETWTMNSPAPELIDIDPPGLRFCWEHPKITNTIQQLIAKTHPEYSLIPKQLQELAFDRVKAPGFDRSQTGPYC